MISKIDITKFGLFKGYGWDNSIGRDITFRKLNIIYGRNYSGKTTLARVFKCLEDTVIHQDYPDCGFSILTENGKIYTTNNLADFESENRLRVYNTDFVRKNLSWLHKNDGTIEPFTILGAKNVDLDKQISDIEQQLGSIDGKSGLLFEHFNAQASLSEKNKFIDQKNSDLENKLRKRANDVIKMNSNLFLATTAKKSYSISDIKTDISAIEHQLPAYILTSEQSDVKIKLLKETSLPDLQLLSETKPKFNTYYTECNETLKRKIKPSQPIADLINDSLLQEWVRNGIDKHKGKRATCGFCGNSLDAKLWDKLDAHFSKESEELRTDIRNKIATLEQSQKSLAEFLIVSKDAFYNGLHQEFDVLIQEWGSVKKTYNESLETIIFQLKEREKDIFKERELPEITDVSESLLNVLKNINKLIVTHNSKTNSLAADQNAARKELKYSNIAQFLTDIGYLSELSAIKTSTEEREIFEKSLTPTAELINSLFEQKRILETQAKDESKGAELVNEHLSHFFGHNELKLVSIGQAPNLKFQIHRDGIAANNLSEGECSLISFCYFIAKMEDELKDAASSNKLIIYIDDPISSLDSNHIFFMFSLIESVIAKDKKYGQMFVSTHNLDFLKYLKKLTRPKYKPQPNSNDHEDVKYFLIERNSKTTTALKLAPDYLKNYITEFNYLFEQIYKCSISDMDTILLEHQYNFGNNMRKFLEAYLFYRYPSHKMSLDGRLIQYFNNDSITINLVNRVINEYSHIGEQFERGIQPIDIDEIKKISIAVIDKIKTEDVHQYNALMESIGVN